MLTEFDIFVKNKYKNMFGDLMGMMGKLQDAQKKVEETKQRLNTVLIDEQSADGLLKLTVTANREIKNLEIAEELLQDKEQLEDYLILTLNKALNRAGAINETELAAAAKDGMPNIPGMDLFK
jgi:DNA-binding YbaB/EbfC family protein